MFARTDGSAWEVFASAKLNLYLEVLGRRSDGFHDLETLMVPISVYDRLRWRPAAPCETPGLTLSCRGRSPLSLDDAAPLKEANLVWQAAQLIARSAGIPPHGHFTVEKHIPSRAGLGGGSSDAAAALALANAAWGINYPISRLVQLAAQLGSDVPFFFAAGPALCQGRGELIQPVEGLPRLHVVVTAPPQGVSTAEAFRQLDAQELRDGGAQPAPPRLETLLSALRAGRVAELSRLMFNRLQSAAAEICPWIRRLEMEFARLPWRGHGMTGSGSAYFGVSRSARGARQAASLLSSRGLGTTFAAATCR